MKSSTNMAAAITQWKARAISECRSMRSGRLANVASSVGFGRRAFPMRRQQHVAAVRHEEHHAGNSEAQKSVHETCVRMLSPQGFNPHFTKSMFRLSPLP